MLRVNMTSNRAILLRSAIAAAIIFALLIGGSNIRDRFRSYVADQESKLESARQEARAQADSYRESINHVVVGALNETGGTMHVYVGEIGKMQDLGNGVSGAAPPVEVQTVAPHGRTSLVVSDWRNKFVTSTTTYIWLSSVNAQALRLIDASYFEDGSPPTAITIFRAAVNSQDNNYSAMPGMNGQTLLSGMSVATSQDAQVSQYESNHAVDAGKYPTSFISFVKSSFGIYGNY